MLALMVGVFIAIDVIILLVYTIVDGARGNLGAELRPNDEHVRTEIGVSIITHPQCMYKGYSSYLVCVDLCVCLLIAMCLQVIQRFY